MMVAYTDSEPKCKTLCLCKGLEMVEFQYLIRDVSVQVCVYVVQGPVSEKPVLQGSCMFMNGICFD